MTPSWDLDEVGRLCDAVDHAEGPTDKGRAMEVLAAHVLGCIPGLEVRERNLYSSDGSQEVDLVLWNRRSASGLPTFSETVLVECKNWQSPVGSAPIAWLFWKMDHAQVSHALLFARNGVTGDGTGWRDAEAAILWAKSRARTIVVLTPALLRSCAQVDDLVHLVEQQVVRLAARKGPLVSPVREDLGHEG